MRSVYWRLLRALPAVPSLKLQFLVKHGYVPDLRNGDSFSEKVQKRKLYESNDLFTLYADKIAVKTIVAERVGPDWVTPTIWSGTELPPRHLRNWPIPFIVKASHASGWNYFVRSEKDLDWDVIEALSQKWATTSWHRHVHEGFYNKIERRVLVEPIIGPPNASPPDFKFFVFRGSSTVYVQVDTDRSTNHKRCFYDSNWIKQPFALCYPFEPREVARPAHFDAMLDAARKLAEPFEFARVDLYDLDDHPKFGEITFTPGSGYEVFTPADYDKKLGALWAQQLPAVSA